MKTEQQTDERFINLETKLAYQEDTIQTLNDIVTRQQQQITQLEDDLKYLLTHLKSLTENVQEIQDTHEKPPHY
ncbi:SlyX family protein [Candidatus Venteria ishoeyi]|uniref:SlyX family protein n=1 Tax=Candidatus Venteria ishoeyi TaxID=1899563 RepID=UPI0025A51D89|nr:SlyX family protein [Candidatus Venteria ishoeyi]MDM8547772.1 SlyX family protein [Candidatus Venteria ishoeyi]